MTTTYTPSTIHSQHRPRRKRRSIRFSLVISAITLVVVLCVALVVYAGLVAWTLTHPKRSVFHFTPTQYGLSYQTIRFASRVDHLQLHGWLITPKPGVARIASGTRPLVIFAHGYTQARGIDTPAMPLAQAFAARGVTTLMFDFRAEGRSPGSVVTVGDYESRDVLGAVDYALAHGYNRIGVVGFSMGASTALLAAEQDPVIRAVVADSPFANLTTYLSTNMPHWSHLPNFPFTPIMLAEMPLLTGANPSAVNPLSGMSKLQHTPVLFIAGMADHTISDQNSEQLMHAATDSHDQLWLVPGAKHVGSYTVFPKAYLLRVTSFVDHALQFSLNSQTKH